jgi:hypothetical protein
VLIEPAAANLNGVYAEVRSGAKFENGVLVERPDESKR